MGAGFKTNRLLPHLANGRPDMGHQTLLTDAWDVGHQPGAEFTV